jgi:predicted transcriptional regulator
MHVLLSIRPQFARLIFQGTKKYEYRKAIFGNEEVDTILVYACQPVGMIVGELKIEDILCASPGALWRKTRKHAGVSRTFFFEYFSGRDRGYAIKIGAAALYERPIDPYEVLESFTPPQSFMYLTSSPSWDNEVAEPATSLACLNG